VLVVRYRRVRRRISRRFTLFTGWVWVAAFSFIGIEMFEVVFGTFLLAPELLPLALVGFAACWYFREQLTSARRRFRLAARLAVRRRRRR